MKPEMTNFRPTQIKLFRYRGTAGPGYAIVLSSMTEATLAIHVVNAPDVIRLLPIDQQVFSEGIRQLGLLLATIHWDEDLISSNGVHFFSPDQFQNLPDFGAALELEFVIGASMYHIQTSLPVRLPKDEIGDLHHDFIKIEGYSRAMVNSLGRNGSTVREARPFGWLFRRPREVKAENPETLLAMKQLVEFNLACYCFERACHIGDLVDLAKER